MTIIYIAQSERLFDAYFEILHCFDVFARCQTLCKPDRTYFHANLCQLFLPQKYDVISQLCHSYTMGPFCMTQIK